MVMKETLDKLAQILSENDVSLTNVFNSGAKLQEIEEAEKLIGANFNDELKDIYQLYNGNDVSVIWMIEGCRYLSLDEMIEQWRELKKLMEDPDFSDMDVETDDSIQSVWIDEKWIPLFSGGESTIFVDLNPAKSDAYGQVLMKYNDEEAYVISESIVNLLDSVEFDTDAEYFVSDLD
jgi:cell wall assembly regulator SMI1